MLRFVLAGTGRSGSTYVHIHMHKMRHDNIHCMCTNRAALSHAHQCVMLYVSLSSEFFCNMYVQKQHMQYGPDAYIVNT